MTQLPILEGERGQDGLVGLEALLAEGLDQWEDDARPVIYRRGGEGCERRATRQHRENHQAFKHSQHIH